MGFPKNILYYQIQPSMTTSDQLGSALMNYPFSPCGAIDWFSRGFVSLAPSEMGETLAYKVDDEFILVALRSQEKRIPASVIREKLDEMVKAMESSESRRVGKKEKQQLRERITDELLPHIQPTSQIIRAWLDMKRGRLIVDTSSTAKAEMLIGMLRTAHPPFPSRLPKPKLLPSAQMTAWLQDETPPYFTLDADCELKAPGEGGAVVRFSRQDLTASEVRAHLDREMLVTKLGMTWCDRISFVMTEQGLRKVSILDVEAESVDGEDAVDVFRSEQILFSQEMRNLLDALEDALGGLDLMDDLIGVSDGN